MGTSWAKAIRRSPLHGCEKCGLAFATIDISSANVVIAGAIVTVTLPAALEPETQYYVEVDAGSIEDIAGNPFAGISGSESWSFTTINPGAIFIYTGPNTTNGTDTWNNPDNWDNDAVPSGPVSVLVPSGKIVTASSTETPSYSEGLALEGELDVRNTSSAPNAIGSGPITFSTGATLRLRVGTAQNPLVIPGDILFAGDAEIVNSSNSSETVDSLFINGVQVEEGYYNSGSGLLDGNGDNLIGGSGTLTVLTGPDTPVGTPFDDWAGDFPGLTDPDPTLDFDGGGLATALEWVLGGDPTNSADDTTILPTLDASSDPDGKVLFKFPRRVAAAEDENTTIIVEYGSDLTGWLAAVDQVNGVSYSEDDTEHEGIKMITVALPPTFANDGKLFVRLNVVVATTD